MNIESKDISVVLQGPIDSVYTPECIKSIRKNLPDSEIIVSTWENEDAKGLDYDKVIFNDDPGCSYDDWDKTRAFNINRWIVSSKNGVECANRKYILKCRSDVEIVNTDFLNYWDQYEKREQELCVVSHKIIIPSPYTLQYLGDKKKEAIIPTPFHVSDWYCFGLKDDVSKFVDCPLIEELKKFARYYEKRNYDIPYNTRWWMQNWLRKMAPEQYIGLCLVQKKFPDIDICNVFTFRNFDLDFAEKFLINNFIVLDPKQYGIILNKYEYFSNHIYILENHLWEGMYRNYIYEKKYFLYYERYHTKKIDVQDIYHRLNRFKSKLEGITRRQKERIWIINEKLHRWVDKKPKIHIVTFSLLHVKRGEQVYKEIQGSFGKDKEILVCPYRGTGDSYIVGNYYKQKKDLSNYIFTVPRELNKKILELFGIKNVVILSPKKNQYLQEFQRIMQMKDVKILHYAPQYEQGNVGYNLAGYKKLNFADCYDYIVFGEKAPILYHKISSLNGEVDYTKIFGIPRGKTVLIAPYSDSIDSFDRKEWEYIVKKLNEKGYTVVTNCGNKKEKPIKGSQGVNIGFEQIAEFVEWCGFFISIRSGICDFVCTCRCKKIIFHPKYIRYRYGRYIDFFTLNLPERGLEAEEYEYYRNGNLKIIKKMLNTFGAIDTTGEA